MKSTLLAFTIIATPATAFAQCPISVGSTAQMETGESAYDRLSQLAVTKGEFETTAQFEARTASSDQASNGPILVEVIVDQEQIKYDADRGAFVTREYAWDNQGFGWGEALQDGKEHGLSASMISYNHGVVAQQKTTVLGSHEASNAYGATVNVIKSIENHYAIYDRKKESSDTLTWKQDYIESAPLYPGSSRMTEKPFYSILVPLDQAKRVKGTMKAAVSVTPRTPTVLTGSRSYSAKITNPNEKTVNSNVIIGDMHCIVITDAQNVVLKIVDIAY